MTAMAQAFDKASGKKTPWNPSRTAIAKVKDKLPVPEKCPHCGNEVEIIENSAIYGRSYGDWPWSYHCSYCDAYVGMHPFTNLPLGTLATRELRELRKQVKKVFNPIWENIWEEKHMSRSLAYSWLADKLGIPKSKCHVGWFDVETCKRAIEVCKTFKAK